MFEDSIYVWSNIVTANLLENLSHLLFQFSFQSVIYLFKLSKLITLVVESNVIYFPVAFLSMVFSQLS